jgi:hypothetical protein
VSERKIVFWSDGVSERLCWETENDCIEGMLDGMNRPWPDRITICGFARMIVDVGGCDVLERMLEILDEEYGNPDGREDEPTPAMLEAEKAFLAVMQREYRPWACEEITSKEIEVMPWVREHAPNWLTESTP